MMADWTHGRGPLRCFQGPQCSDVAGPSRLWNSVGVAIHAGEFVELGMAQQREIETPRRNVAGKLLAASVGVSRAEGRPYGAVDLVGASLAREGR